MKNQQPAFSVSSPIGQYGMSERLYVATEICKAIISNRELEKEKCYNDIIKDAIILADELIEQCKKAE